MQILPSTALRGFIKHYLFLACENTSIQKLRLFSDGNMGMVFSFSTNLLSNIQFTGRFEQLPASFVYGQISEFKDLYLVNGASLVIVVFQPAGLHQLLGIPAKELRDNIIGTEDLFGWQAPVLQEKLAEQITIEGKIQLLNAFFEDSVIRKKQTPQLLIEASVHFILQNKGANTIHQLVKHTGYTERHIERTFVECIGLGPKKFSNIVKLHGFLKLLKNKAPHQNLTGLSYKAGYADQSHLVREFRKYTGITPKEYLHKTNKLANNFLELNTAVENMSVLSNFPGWS